MVKKTYFEIITEIPLSLPGDIRIGEIKLLLDRLDKNSQA